MSSPFFALFLFVVLRQRVEGWKLLVVNWFVLLRKLLSRTLLFNVSEWPTGTRSGLEFLTTNTGRCSLPLTLLLQCSLLKQSGHSPFCNRTMPPDESFHLMSGQSMSNKYGDDSQMKMGRIQPKGNRDRGRRSKGKTENFRRYFYGAAHSA